MFTERCVPWHKNKHYVQYNNDKTKLPSNISQLRNLYYTLPLAHNELLNRNIFNVNTDKPLGLIVTYVMIVAVSIEIATQ